MFRPLRRSKQSLPRAETDAILRNGSYGVLSLSDSEEYPYGVPLSYVYEDDKIWFHCAKSGHKLDIIRENPRASFCVVGQDTVVQEEYTSYFKSVIVFGTVRVLESDLEKRAAIRKLGRKYSPDRTDEDIEAAIERNWSALCMLEMDIVHVSGKQARELIPVE